jgi:hypothetical protein
MGGIPPNRQAQNGGVGAPDRGVCFYGGGRCGRPVYMGCLLKRVEVQVRREGAGGNRLTCPIRIFKFLMSFCRLSRDRPVEGQHVVFEATRSVNGLWGGRVEVESVDGC